MRLRDLLLPLAIGILLGAAIPVAHADSATDLHRIADSVERIARALEQCKR